MTPPNSLIDRIVAARLFAHFRWRACVFAPLIALLLLLAFYPERYKAASSITPSDSASLGLSGTLGQLGAINSVFGNQAAIEVAMRVAKSVSVRERVIEDPRLAFFTKGRDRLRLHRWLDRKVDIRSLRGGIISVEMLDTRRDVAREIVAAYVRATQEQLTLISRRQTNYKRQILRELVADASTEMIRAQEKYDAYRLKNGYADPHRSIESTGNRIPLLESEIKGRLIALSAARKLYTDSNLTVKQQLAEIGALQGQLTAAKATQDQHPDSLGKLVVNSNELFPLERELGISRALYDSYMRYLQGTAVEDLTATSNVRILEEAYIDTARQYNQAAVIGAMALLLLWLAIEFYRLRPPVGSRFGRRSPDV